MMKRIALLIILLTVLLTFLVFPYLAHAQPACSDGIDNDGDGFIDYPADPDCKSATDDMELKPTLVGYYDTWGRVDDVYVVGNYVYLADITGLKILDISNPSNPIRKGEVMTPGGTHSIYVRDNYAYLIDYIMTRWGDKGGIGYGLKIIGNSGQSPIFPSYLKPTYGGNHIIFDLRQEAESIGHFLLFIFC